MLLTIVTFLIVLSVLVLVHEAGHFFTARLFKVKVEEFGLGFPPRGIGWQGKKIIKGNRDLSEAEKKDGVVYSLNWIPLGGFVKIKGENDNSTDSDSFAGKPVGQRFLIIAAGVLMNIILAIVLISIGFAVGWPQATDGLNANSNIISSDVRIVEVLKDSPASQAGLKVNDQILSVDGVKVKTEADVQTAIAKKTGSTSTLEIISSKQNKEVKLVPEKLTGFDHGVIGVGLSATAVVRYPLGQAFIEGVKTSGRLMGAIVMAFYDLFRKIIIGQNVSDEVGGPVRIAQITGEAASMGFIYLLQFTAFLSLNLAVINFLPLPALDGGRAVFLAIEKLRRGKPIKKEFETALHNIGFWLLVLLLIWITVKDIIRIL